MVSQAINRFHRPGSERSRPISTKSLPAFVGDCLRPLYPVVAPATAPATARHASGMENESKNPSAPPPAVELIPLGTWSTLSRTSPVHPKLPEEVLSNTNANTFRRQRSIACPLPPPNSDTGPTQCGYLQAGQRCPCRVSINGYARWVRPVRSCAVNYPLVLSL